MDKKFIGEILIELGFIDEQQLKNALDVQQVMKQQGRIALLGEILIEQQSITRNQFNEALIVSLEEVVSDENTKDFIREITNHAMKNLRSLDRSTKMGYMSEEGQFTLKTRLKELEGRLEGIKKKLHNEQSAKMTEFRVMSIQNLKNQLIDLETKISALRKDIELFCQ